MKVRIKENSVRYRLTKSEVEELSMKGYYEEKTAFINQPFTYRLVAQESNTHLTATYINNTLTIFMPQMDALQWFDADKIGYQHDFLQDNGESLFLLIEKDFVCLDETVEDQSDNYPHPLEDSLKDD